jgi:hypothetical protein
VEELVKLVSAKTGLGKDQAAIAVKTVLDFLKSRLPAPVAAQVDAVLNNSGLMGMAANALDDGKIDGSDVSNLLGGFLGGNK